MTRRQLWRQRDRLLRLRETYWYSGRMADYDIAWARLDLLACYLRRAGY
jgi:hypothetical protein